MSRAVGSRISRNYGRIAPWIVLLGVAIWFVQTKTAGRLDHEVFEALIPLRGSVLDSFFVQLSADIRPLTLAPLSAVIALVLWWKLRRLALLVPLSFASSIALTYVVKWVVDRPRPGLELSLVDVHDAAFPSAHVAGVASMGMALWQSLLPVLRRTARKLLQFSVIGLIGIMGIARVWVGAHWLTDVIGGLITAVIGFGIAVLILRLWKR